MHSKYLTRNLILLIIMTLFVSVVCIVNNHAKAAYPDVQSASYDIDHLIYQADNLNFAEDDTFTGTTVHRQISFLTAIIHCLSTTPITRYLLRRMSINGCIPQV